ncbi:hypothetical protein Pmani_031898 [Petrolisthes manimaculis]|uniref:Uncharacterized protein n=1 Tax=Petrolisthes manimaculis TaxID=1843537 RepID=A0AAE1TRJ0_9EUCA|nr:hypothetical protein Pmani_031898 [Petrolisthes manimaculis]
MLQNIYDNPAARTRSVVATLTVERGRDGARSGGGWSGGGLEVEGELKYVIEKEEKGKKEDEEKKEEEEEKKEEEEEKKEGEGEKEEKRGKIKG